MIRDFFIPEPRIPGSPIRIHNTGGQGERLQGGKKVEERDNISVQNGIRRGKRKGKGRVEMKIFVFQIRRRGNRTRKNMILFFGVGSRIGEQA